MKVVIRKIINSRTFIWIVRILGVFAGFIYLGMVAINKLLPLDSTPAERAWDNIWIALYFVLGLLLLFPLTLLRRASTAVIFFRILFWLTILEALAIVSTLGATSPSFGIPLLLILIGNVWAAKWKAEKLLRTS